MATNTIEKPKPSFALKKLSLLVVIVDHGVSDVFIDYFKTLEVNLELQILASGTVKEEIRNLLGLNEIKKDVLFSVIQEEKLDQAFNYIETRFKLSPKHKGIAFNIKITSVVGLSVYKILSNTHQLEPVGGNKYED